MTRARRDPTRCVTIVCDGAEIYRGAPTWQKAATLLRSDPAAQTRVVNETRLSFVIASSKHAEFWTEVDTSCKVFATCRQWELTPVPSAKEVRTAETAARNMKNALKPFLGINSPNLLYEDLFAYAHVFQHHLGNRHWLPMDGKQKADAARMFIGDLGGLYSVGFGRNPSSSFEGPFTRFALACLAETTGLPEAMGADWVKKYVRVHERAFTSNKKPVRWPVAGFVALSGGTFPAKIDRNVP